MSRHLELVPDNNLVWPAQVFDRASILASVTIAATERAQATSYVDRHAPDLRNMIFGDAA